MLDGLNKINAKPASTKTGVEAEIINIVSLVRNIPRISVAGKSNMCLTENSS